MSFQVGERVGDYEVMQVLGAGGMGKVYKVRNVISERVEAMKVLLPNLESDPELADRFMREIKVQARLQHPHIAALHTAQRVNNQLLMMIEFVEGETLEQLMRKGPIPLDACVLYFQQVLSALAYAHQNGVVHRDIKPANMMLTPGGQMKLMDFGIAKMAVDRRLTQTGRTVGSLFYMSPEQINGEQNLDGRSDLYSLGVSLYEAATGRRPFLGDSDYSIMAAHLQSRPVPPIELDPKLPAVLNDIILMAIAKDPAQRFQSADAFRRALDSAAGAPAPLAKAGQAASPASAQPVPLPATKPGSARTLYMAIGSVVTIIVLAVAAIQGPKWFRSSASSQAPQNLSYQTPAEPQDQPGPAAPVPTGSSNDPAAQQQPAQQTSEPQSTAAQQTPVQQTPVQQTPVQQPPVRQTDLAKPQSRPQVQQTPAQNIAQQTRPDRAPTESPATQPTQMQAQQAKPEPAKVVQPDNSAEISEARENLMLLGTRANSMIASVTRMQQQQASSGLGMRPDVLNARQRMEFHLNEAEAAVRAGDSAKAKRSLGLAEKEVEKLESFFGR